MTPSPSAEPSMNVSVQGPYEAAIIAGFSLLEKVIDGQTPEIKKQMWENYLTFTQPWHDLNVALTSKIVGAIENLLKLKQP